MCNQKKGKKGKGKIENELNRLASKDRDNKS
jgi:hypothetical protein